jgi:hypothetical protein
VIRGSTEDLMQGRSAILPSATVGARLEWRERLNARLGLRVFAEVHVALARAEFLLDDVAIWTEPRAQVHVGAGGFLNFP